MTKYALLKYETSNIGDDIQSLAAGGFLPKIDYYINRESLGKIRFKHKTKIIMNGWFKEDAKDWIADNSAIEPLFISFHLSNDALLTQKNIDYFKKYQPIGCRDIPTLNKLKEKGINTFFSACLTLTLKNEIKSRGEKIYFVDVDKNYIDFVPQKNRENVEFITHQPFGKNQSNIQRFDIAKNLLEKYQSAKTVITSRLHCALPCLAYGTPVMLVIKKPEDPRFKGFEKYLHICKKDDAAKHLSKIDWENPKLCKADISAIRKDLIKNCENFIKND